MLLLLELTTAPVHACSPARTNRLQVVAPGPLPTNGAVLVRSSTARIPASLPVEVSVDGVVVPGHTVGGQMTEEAWVFVPEVVLPPGREVRITRGDASATWTTGSGPVDLEDPRPLELELSGLADVNSAATHCEPSHPLRQVSVRFAPRPAGFVVLSLVTSTGENRGKLGLFDAATVQQPVTVSWGRASTRDDASQAVVPYATPPGGECVQATFVDATGQSAAGPIACAWPEGEPRPATSCEVGGRGVWQWTSFGLVALASLRRRRAAA